MLHVYTQGNLLKGRLYRCAHVAHLIDLGIAQNVENDYYLLRLIRYIHRNPEKAGICKTDNYKWSSYNEYVYGEKIIIKTNLIYIIHR